MVILCLQFILIYLGKSLEELSSWGVTYVKTSETLNKLLNTNNNDNTKEANQFDLKRIFLYILTFYVL